MFRISRKMRCCKQLQTYLKPNMLFYNPMRYKYPIIGYSFYHALWIESNASKEEIEQAYKKMKDSFDNDESDEWAKAVFGEAELAYRILINPETRKEYDVFIKVSWWVMI